jgi:hypothetical protein
LAFTWSSDIWSFAMLARILDPGLDDVPLPVAA